MKELDEVRQMYEKFEIAQSVPWGKDREKKHRSGYLHEEITEYLLANSKADELDALVDLFIFVLGTIERNGYSKVFDEAFRRVMVANMQKERGLCKSRSEFHIDLVKPDTWVSADLNDLVDDSC